MKAQHIIATALLASVMLVSCKPLNQDDTWQVTVHTTMVYNQPRHINEPQDTIMCPYYDRLPEYKEAAIYKHFDFTLIDTMIRVVDLPFHNETFYLSTGEIIEPVAQYKYRQDGTVFIDNLTDDAYLLLHLRLNTLKGDIYEFTRIDKSQRNTTIYDTMWRFGEFFAE